jgi:Reverse transcriptase (RNA-dependent DNA polymerase)
MKNNVYGNKAAGRVWNRHLVKKLQAIGFAQSKHDECLFYFKTTVHVLYTDDSVLTGPNQGHMDEALRKMSGIGLDIINEGDVGDFLGIRIDRQGDDTVKLLQQHLIESILRDLRLDRDRVTVKGTPAAPNILLQRYTNSETFDQSFDYLSVCGKLMYLSTTRLDCAFAINQCARFGASPKKEHGEAVRYLGRYLAGTRGGEGIILRPDREKGFDVQVDADFCGAWDPSESEDPDTARSRSGYSMRAAPSTVVQIRNSWIP